MTVDAQKLSENLSDAGKIIEGGWLGLRLLAIPENAPQVQIDEMRTAFFAGAEHLFSSIMCVMDSDREPTESDLHRISMIHAELEAFRKDFELNHLPTKGKA